MSRSKKGRDGLTPYQRQKGRKTDQLGPRESTQDVADQHGTQLEMETSSHGISKPSKATVERHQHPHKGCR